MKYYSELTKKVYDTEKELNEAESVHTLAQKEKEEKLAVKKEKANKVLEAYKESVAVRKECNQKIYDADKKYLDLRDEFIKEYGSWHMSYSDIGDAEIGDIDYTFYHLGKFISDLFN